MCTKQFTPKQQYAHSFQVHVGNFPGELCVRPQIVSRFKKVGIMKHIFADHNRNKLEINNRSKIGKFTDLWKLNSMYLNNQ